MYTSIHADTIVLPRLDYFLVLTADLAAAIFREIPSLLSSPAASQ